MSRSTFRHAVASPRPRAAVAMVAVATLTLGMTGQIAPWALGVSGGCIVTAAWLRERSLPWQHSAPLLNSALLLALGVAAALFLRGELVVIALAHFAVLTQGLQLLDARPRRSEFLLVALALFQVILAANLTESLLFPVLLMAFTIATVWTLLLHTLRAEAIAAHEPAAAAAALSDGLRRTITFASVASVVLALVLFPLLPRLRVGALLAGGTGSEIGISGFSDRVELGDLGRIRLDPRVVLRVDTDAEASEPGAEDLAATERYVRGMAFDHFDGRRWSVTPADRERIAGDAARGVLVAADPAPRRRGPMLVQRITREPMDASVVFAAGRLLAVRGALGRLEMDVAGTLYAARTPGERIDYSTTSRLATPSDVELVIERATPPDESGRHLALPPLSPRLAEQARRVVAGAASDAERARRLETWLRREGHYTDRPPMVAPDDAVSPVERFLEGGMAGHCEYFASAMALMARSLGLPARIVNGFAGGLENGVGDFVEYAQSDAHTWVEIHYERAGWVRYDPTPPDLRMAGAEALREGSDLAELFSAVELWWFRNVVDFDRGTQARALRGLWQRWQDLRAKRRVGSSAPEGGGSRPELPALDERSIALLLALVLAAFAARRLWRSRRDTIDPPDYARALRLLTRRGLRRGASTTARAFAREVGRALPDAAGDFDRLTEAHLHVRFGGAPGPETATSLAGLRRSLRGSR